MNAKQYTGLILSVAVTLAVAATLFGVSPVLSFGGVATNSIGANEVVPNTCIPSVANTLITFPSTQPGAFASTSNAENVVNEGNANSNILVFGVNWISSSAAFHVSNTLWNPTTSASAVGTELTNVAVDTLIPLKANGGGNVIFFGLNIPAGQAAGSYNQAVTIEGSC